MSKIDPPKCTYCLESKQSKHDSSQSGCVEIDSSWTNGQKHPRVIF
jgi:hypothetical protein